MHPFLQNPKAKILKARFRWVLLPVCTFILLSVAIFMASGCVGVSGQGSPPPPPPPIEISITPPNGSVILGNSLTFTATVKNTTDTSVAWSVNGTLGGTSSSGFINGDGVYTAPNDLPALVTVQVKATSLADATKSATATVTIVSDVTLSLAPTAASVELGATQGFQALVVSAGHPDNAVQWSVSGPACATGCGSVDANGNYTAPQILPVPANVTLIATSKADSSKQASETVVITSNFSLTISSPGTMTPGAAATLVATLTPVPGSNPSRVLSWALSGPGCNGSSCGILTAVTTQNSGAGSTSDSAAYVAPNAPPSPNTVTVTVTPQADPSKKAQATILIQAGAGVSISPITATLAVNHRVLLTAQVSQSIGGGMNWAVNGVSGGSGTIGKICVVASNPCQTISDSNILQVEFLAPGAIPSANPVTVTATSVVDATQNASAQITIINHVLVSVIPGNVILAPLQVQGFSAAVLGTTNQSVVWQIQGTPCASAGACGAIDPTGTYTAPAAVPSPDALQVVAISSDDTTQSGTATLTISTGANILTLHPASVYAGAANGFVLKVDGSGFLASSPGPGSVLLIGGTPRTTTCISTMECTAPVTPTDVASPGEVSVQIQNSASAKSNAVSLLAVMPANSDDLISLTSASPVATGKDIVVVDPTTAGVSVPGDDVDLNVAALGAFTTSTNTCTLGGNPVVLVRPLSGTTTTDICVFSESGLDTSMTFTISGPGDVSVIAKQPSGLGIIHLTLQISSNSTPGERTLFIQNTNLDKTAASGALEVN